MLLSNRQRHSGCDVTTLDNWEQQDDDGVDEFPVTKLRQGDRPTSVLVQLV